MLYTNIKMNGIYFGKKNKDVSFTVQCALFSSAKPNFTGFSAKNQPF